MFPDVAAARALRARMLAAPADYRYPVETRCPVCGRSTGNHNSKATVTAGGATWSMGFPCWRRGEWDRYGLHISPTRVEV